MVLRRQIIVDSGIAVLTLLAIVALGLILTLIWVAHNLRLAARLGRRKGFPAPPEPFTLDYLGRTIVAPPLADLRAATASGYSRTFANVSARALF